MSWLKFLTGGRRDGASRAPGRQNDDQAEVARKRLVNLEVDRHARIARDEQDRQDRQSSGSRSSGADDQANERQARLEEERLERASRLQDQLDAERLNRH